jgi:cytochrome c551/c552
VWKVKNTVIIFIISTLVGLGIGYLYFNFTGSNSNNEHAQTVNNQTASKDKTEKGSVTSQIVDANTEIFTQKGCLQCHSISKLNLKGGAVGPDLSGAYATVEGKHGKPLAEFLKAPTSATMAGVIKGNPLTDEERTKIVDVLKSISDQ